LYVLLQYFYYYLRTRQLSQQVVYLQFFFLLYHRLFLGSLGTGLVAYYPLDGGSSNDFSGNGYHGTVRGSAYQIVADRYDFPSSAFQLSGSNAFIELPGTPFNFQNSFSFSIWVYPFNTQASYATVLDKSSWLTGTGGTGGFSFNQEADNINFMRFGYVYSTGYFWSTYPPTLLTVNKWNHVVVTKNDDFINLYLNSMNVYSGHSGHVSIVDNDNKPLLIGALNGGYTNPATQANAFYNGIVDDIYFYNRELTVNEVLKLYQLETPTSQPTSQPSRQPSGQPTRQPSSQPTIQPSALIIGQSSSLKEGLVAHYPFDGGSANDKSGNGFNGIKRGSITSVVNRFGNVRSALGFNGVDTYVEVPHGGAFTFRFYMSVCLWIKPSSQQMPFATLLDKSHYHGCAGDFCGWWFGQAEGATSAYTLAFYQSGLSYQMATLPGISLGGWNHLCFTKNNAIFRTFLNGQFVGAVTSTAVSPVLNGNLPLVIGATSADGATNPVTTLRFLYNGSIDDIFIYNRTLSSDEVQMIYSFDSPTSQPSNHPSSQPSNLPSAQPSGQPSVQPSVQPTSLPTNRQKYISSSSIDLTSINKVQGISFTGGVGFSNVGCNVDGDQYSDVLLGGSNTVYLIYGSTVLSSSGPPFSSRSVKIVGRNEDDGFGYAVACADVNGDGLDDMIIGAPFSSPSRTGTVYLIWGHRSLPSFLNISQSSFSFFGVTIRGAGVGFLTGMSLSTADINGDGLSDILIGAPSNIFTTALSGKVYVVLGQPLQTFSTSAVIELLFLNSSRGFSLGYFSSNDGLGYSVNGLGDINGDGFEDFAAVAASVNDAFIVFGRNSTVENINLSSLSPNQGFILSSLRTPWAIGGIGDFNGDLIDDFAVADMFGVFVVFGRLSSFIRVQFPLPSLRLFRVQLRLLSLLMVNHFHRKFVIAITQLILESLLTEQVMLMVMVMKISSLVICMGTDQKRLFSTEGKTVIVI
jgi:hypothetical protein